MTLDIYFLVPFLGKLLEDLLRQNEGLEQYRGRYGAQETECDGLEHRGKFREERDATKSGDQDWGRAIEGPRETLPGRTY